MEGRGILYEDSGVYWQVERIKKNVFLYFSCAAGRRTFQRHQRIRNNLGFPENLRYLDPRLGSHQNPTAPRRHKILRFQGSVRRNSVLPQRQHQSRGGARAASGQKIPWRGPGGRGRPAFQSQRRFRFLHATAPGRILFLLHEGGRKLTYAAQRQI